MALDGLTLGFVARELSAALVGARVDRVQQPEKDMVVLWLRGAGQNHRLLINASPTGTRMHLTEQSYESPQDAPVFCMLMRKHLVSGRVQSVEQLQGDRLVEIRISGYDELGELKEKQLYFEAMGRHTNLSLVQEGRIIDSLRHVTDEMSRVRRMLPGAPFELPPGQDKLAPSGLAAELLHLRLAQEGGRLDRALANAVLGVGAASAREICLRLCGQEQPQMKDIRIEAFSQAAADFFSRLPDLAQPQLYLDEQGVPRDALPFPYLSLDQARQEGQESLSLALDRLHFERDRQDRLMQRSAAFRRTLRSAQERVLRKLALQEEELSGAARMEEYRVAGELLTAMGHQVPKGAERVTLTSYYDGQPVEIALDPSLSAAANAQRYFKRYRKAHVARRTAAEQKENSLRELGLIEDALWAVQEAQTMQDMQQIRQPLADAGILRQEKAQKGRAKPRESQPLRYRSPEGLSILVGRNSLQNEKLLQKAQGSDLWLHAKDMAGSHVILVNPGEPLPEEALLLAGRLAAFHSKGRGQQVPVNYTFRRYVRKPSGAPAGFVTFTNEKLMILSADEGMLTPFREEDR